MGDQNLVYPKRDNKENLLDNQVQNQNKSYMLFVNMNAQFQKNSTPDQIYNITDLV